MLSEEQQIRFTTLWTDAQPTVSQFVASLVRDQWAVRDIVQNTSVALLRRFGDFDESRPFLPWALGVARFEILGHRRDAARNRLIADTDLLEQYTQAWAAVAPQLDDEATALRHCMSQLPERTRSVMKLRYADSETSASIARQLSLTAANVRAILKRTRDGLKRCVEKRLSVGGAS